MIKLTQAEILLIERLKVPGLGDSDYIEKMLNHPGDSWDKKYIHGFYVAIQAMAGLKYDPKEAEHDNLHGQH